jgi:deazaflavin-dependent oxidoreductase (nitroreductase family)
MIGMYSPSTAPPAHESRGFWGVRKKPGRLALALFRLPLRVSRNHPERLPGDVFLTFVHVGRNTGQPHEAVAMVLSYDEDLCEAVICAAWGPETDWVRNLRAGPASRVQRGRESYTPQHRFLSDDEAVEVTKQFRHAHPVRLRMFCALLGWGDLRDDDVVRRFVSDHPFVAFRPTATVGESGTQR